MSSGEFASLRRESERAMTDRCQVLRPSSTFDAGGEVTTYAVSSSKVPCSVAPSETHQADEQLVGGALQGVALWELLLPAMTDVRGSDAIAMGEAFSGSGITDQQLRTAGARIFQVAQVLDPRTLEIERVVLAYEIR